MVPLLCLLLFCFQLTLALNCPSGYTYYGSLGNCYNVYTTPATYFAAEVQCSLDNGQLASISNSFENSFIKSLIANSSTTSAVWFGLTTQLDTFGQWQWVDNSPVTGYFNWAPGNPANNGYQCTKIAYSTGQWQNGDCSDRLPFVCKFNPSASRNCPICPTVTTPQPSSCPTSAPVTQKPCPVRCDEGWTYYSKTNSCYNTFHNQDWDAGESKCQAAGGHLVSIHSEDENNFVINLSKMGIDGDDDKYQVAIGAKRDSNGGNIYWTDGTPFDYTHWGPEEPEHTSNLCTELYADDYKGERGHWQSYWEMWPCSTNWRAYVCKKAAYS